MECLCYCIANQIDLNRLDKHLRVYMPTVMLQKSRKVLKIEPLDSKARLFIFSNGTVVSWGLKRYQMTSFLDVFHQFSQKIVSFLVQDEYVYRYADQTSIEPHDYFDVDIITLEDDKDELKLSLSYGFSQSIKLQYFETILETLIDKYTPLIHRLSHDGHMDISRKQIRQIIGEILGAKSELNLLSNFLYHPTFFWQHPTLEDYYTMLERYLHIQRRAGAINQRLDTLNEIFDMFNGYLENKHSSSLEVIIIILIAIEIIFGVLNIHF